MRFARLWMALVSGGVLAGCDSTIPAADVVHRVSLQIAGRDSATCLVMTLALIEARSGVPERSKEDVCDVLCGLRCTPAAVAWRATQPRRHYPGVCAGVTAP